MISKTAQWMVAAISLLAIGCGRDSGLPRDLTGLLAAQGVRVRVTRLETPLASRAGIVFFDRDPAMEEKLTAAFHLEKMAPPSPRSIPFIDRIAENPRSLWGIAGRPEILKLKNGAQFEYLYLVVTEGRSYLLAAYAYG